MKEQKTGIYKMLKDDEIRLLRAFDRMNSEQQADFMVYLQHLLHTQEHALDLQLCND